MTTTGRWICLLAAVLLLKGSVLPSASGETWAVETDEPEVPFGAGESLSYNLYYNWQFVWLKAGTASMSTTRSLYNGEEAYRTSLITRGSSRADKYFVMRDTLLCYYKTTSETDDKTATEDRYAVVPLYYRKGAREGKRYYVDEVFYSYPNTGQCHLRQHLLSSKGTHLRKEQTLDHRVYDMLSMFQRARGFDPTNWQKGYTINFEMVDGRKVEKVKLKFLGRSKVKADDGQQYNCLQLSYRENEEGKEKEIVRFFVTDDDRHIPVRLDMNLRFGTAKAFLTKKE